MTLFTFITVMNIEVASKGCFSVLYVHKDIIY